MAPDRSPRLRLEDLERVQQALTRQFNASSNDALPDRAEAIGWLPKRVARNPTQSQRRQGKLNLHAWCRMRLHSDLILSAQHCWGQLSLWRTSTIPRKAGRASQAIQPVHNSGRSFGQRLGTMQ